MITDHTSYFFATHFGLPSVPKWWHKRKELVVGLAALWDARQAIYYEQQPEARYRALQLRLSRQYGITYAAINQLLGVAATDGSDPFGVIKDYLDLGQPKLIRTSRG